MRRRYLFGPISPAYEGQEGHFTEVVNDPAVTCKFGFRLDIIESR
jgi:hypothetical protein